MSKALLCGHWAQWITLMMPTLDISSPATAPPKSIHLYPPQSLLKDKFCMTNGSSYCFLQNKIKHRCRQVLQPCSCVRHKGKVLVKGKVCLQLLGLCGGHNHATGSSPNISVLIKIIWDMCPLEEVWRVEQQMLWLWEKELFIHLLSPDILVFLICIL